jgi:hypothetical protein
MKPLIIGLERVVGGGVGGLWLSVVGAIVTNARRRPPVRTARRSGCSPLNDPLAVLVGGRDAETVTAAGAGTALRL